MEHVKEILPLSISVFAFVIACIGMINLIAAYEESDKMVAKTIENKSSIVENQSIYYDEEVILEPYAVVTEIKALNNTVSVQVNGITVNINAITQAVNGDATNLISYISFANKYRKELILNTNGDVKTVNYVKYQ